MELDEAVRIKSSSAVFLPLHILCFSSSIQTIWTLIRLLLKEHSDLGPHFFENIVSQHIIADGNTNYFIDYNSEWIR